MTPACWQSRPKAQVTQFSFRDISKGLTAWVTVSVRSPASQPSKTQPPRAANTSTCSPNKGQNRNSIWGDFYFRLRSYTKREQRNISMIEGKKRDSTCRVTPPNATNHLSLSHRTAFSPGRQGGFLHQRAAYYTVNIRNINLPQGPTAPATAIRSFLHIYMHAHLVFVDIKKLVRSHTDQTHCFKIGTVTEVHKHQHNHMV